MKLMLTNDDGIFSKGLAALQSALQEIADCLIVAPEYEQSAVGHAISIHKPLIVKEVKKKGSFWGYSVSGMPADCVKLGLLEISGGGVDMVVSGINRGANVGVNLLYSGTVSAASESSIMGTPALAISLDSRDEDADYSYAAKIACKLVKAFARIPFSGYSLNINVPALKETDIKGIVVAPQGGERFFERLEKRITPRGESYFWLDHSAKGGDKVANSDARMLAEGNIVVTPINIDMTLHDVLAGLSAKLGL